MSNSTYSFQPSKVRFDSLLSPRADASVVKPSELQDPLQSVRLQSAQAIDPGNSLQTATNLGMVGAGSMTRSDAVSATDTVDFYRFSITGTNNFSATLGKLSANANLFLLDSHGNVIKAAAAPGNTAEKIRTELNTGTYYLQVVRVAGATNYDLVLSAIAPDQAGNSTRAARNLELRNGSQSFYDAVHGGDRDDFYRFTIDRTINLSLALSGMGADADISLLDSRGRLIVSSASAGSVPELINRSLGAGTYFIRVFQFSGATNYTLNVFSTDQQLPTNYSDKFGYGLVNAAAAVARALNQSPGTAVPNLGGSNWNLDRINAPEAWAQGSTGQGITVAVVDTGVEYTHSELRNNIWVNTREIAGNGIDDDGNGYIDDVRGWNFFDHNNNPMDLNGHGTHVAGTIAASNNGVGVTGVAYNARIMALRALGADGSGDVNAIASAVRYAVNNGAKVINLSLGGAASTVLRDAVEYATKQGAFVVMAAGNSGGSSPISPANLADRWGIAVGATDSTNKLTSFSNRAGASVLNYVVAPGANVFSLGLNNTYVGMSGTSMATPHVAGVAALMLSANSNLLPDQMARILAETANSSAVTV